MGGSTASRSLRRFTPAALFVSILLSALLIVFLQRQIYSSFFHHPEYYDYKVLADLTSRNDDVNRSSVMDEDSEHRQVISSMSAPIDKI